MDFQSLVWKRHCFNCRLLGRMELPVLWKKVYCQKLTAVFWISAQIFWSYFPDMLNDIFSVAKIPLTFFVDWVPHMAQERFAWMVINTLVKQAFPTVSEELHFEYADLWNTTHIIVLKILFPSKRNYEFEVALCSLLQIRTIHSNRLNAWQILRCVITATTLRSKKLRKAN